MQKSSFEPVCAVPCAPSLNTIKYSSYWALMSQKVTDQGGASPPSIWHTWLQASYLAKQQFFFLLSSCFKGKGKSGIAMFALLTFVYI